MLGRRIDAVFITSCMLAVVGCVGGQGGDEGLIDLPGANGPGIEPPNGATPPPADEGNGDDMAGRSRRPGPGSTVEGGFEGFGCGAQIWTGPDAVPVAHYCEGEASDGPWACFCDQAETWVSNDASGCGEALQDVCGVKPDPHGIPQTHCAANGKDAGTCWANDSAGWDCRCGDPTADIALEAVDGGSCTDALFRVCASECDAPLGRCVPVRDGDASSYACDCVYYGDASRVLAGVGCDGAIERACDPEVSGGDDACNSYAGYCDRVTDGFACRCADGMSVAVVEDELGDRDCGAVLSDACGADEPPGDSTCEADGEAFSGRCVALDDTVHSCRCDLTVAPSPPVSMGNSTDGGVPMGSGRQTSGGGTLPFPGGTSAHEVQTAATCTQALSLSCPDALHATEEQKAQACGEQASCNAEVSEVSCLEGISNACAQCTLEAVQSADACVAIDACAAPCNGVIPPPQTAAACRSLIESRGRLDAVSSCFCDNCVEAFGSCVVDAGCTEILECAGETGCSSAGCYAEDTCRDVIDRWGVGSGSTTMAMAVGACESAPTCLATQTADSP